MPLNTGSGCFFEIFKRAWDFKKIAVFDGIDEIYEQDDFIHVRQNEFAMGQQAVTLLEEITTGKKQNEDIIIPYQISGIL